MESPDRKVQLIFVHTKETRAETKPRFDVSTGSYHFYDPLAKPLMEEFLSPATGVYYYADPMAPISDSRRKISDTRRKRWNLKVGDSMENIHFLGNQWRFRSCRSSNSCSCHGRGRVQVSAQERPDLFYQESMVEDPWRALKPMDNERAALAKETSDYNIPGYLKLEVQSECGLSYPAALAVAYDKAFGLGESYDEPLCSNSK
ncbi:hypothetical protein ACHQM5_030391 [Ranunculus cassubicifolius]